MKATTEAQLRATKKYQDGLSRIVLWYPKKEKAHYAKLLKAQNLSFKEVFEAGLKKLGISQ